MELDGHGLVSDISNPAHRVALVNGSHKTGGGSMFW